MIEMLNNVRNITIFSVGFRLFLALFCGGIIGLERSYKRRTAGFRTHILICMGAAVTTMTSQYLYLVMHYYTDIARLGAQVIAGIGFIGAGTIIVTRNQRVKGLTTAAGLWTSAIVGLAIGAGFYEAGITTTILVLIAELFFTKLEYQFLRSAPEINLYMEYREKTSLDDVLRYLRQEKVKILKIQIARNGSKKHNASAFLSLRFNKNCDIEQTLHQISVINGVVSADEL